jgi:hypothetical protein
MDILKTENSALRQFVQTLGFDPNKVIEQMGNPDNYVCKTIALSALRIKPDFSQSTLTEVGRHAASEWLESLK